MLMVRFDLLALLKQRGSIFLTKCTRPIVLLSFLFNMFLFFFPLTITPSNFTCFYMVLLGAQPYLSKIQLSSTKICTKSDHGAELGWVQRHSELVAAHW